MENASFQQTQKASQIQRQGLSQQQIQILKLILMKNEELRDEIYSQVEENPALEIINDSFDGFGKNFQKASSPIDSDNFQKILEASPDESETLQEHLIHQLNMINLNEKKYALCKKLIYNLDENGHHILAPTTLLEKKDKAQTQDFLKECIVQVQALDPSGICCQNVTESLLLQAKQKKNASNLTNFILSGHLDFISPPVSEKIQKKLTDYLKEQKNLAFFSENDKPENFSQPILQKSDITIENIQETVKFIQSLNPFPAHNFSNLNKTHFVQADVYIVRENGKIENDEIEKGLVTIDENSHFKIYSEKTALPKVQISMDFKNTAINSNSFAIEKIKSAQDFISFLEFRKSVILRTFSLIVREQKDFFINGKGNLKQLSQRDFSKIAGVSESSISRMAESKFLECEWGTFPLKHFFSTGVNENSADKIKFEIEKLITEATQKGIHLSDQKISDILKTKGISVARRTISKYRNKMEFENSYNR